MRIAVAIFYDFSIFFFFLKKKISWRKKITYRMPSKTQILSLYKQLLQSSKLYSSYNYKEYVYRRTRDAFHANKHVSQPDQVQDLYKKGLEALEISTRQGWINSQFKSGKLVVE